MSASAHTLTRLTRRQERAIASLLAHATIKEAAEACGASERSVRRWLTLPAFADALGVARREAFGLAVGRLQAIACEAVDVLYRVMRDSESPPATRVAAARSILEFAREGLELDDLQRRLGEIEAAVAQIRHEASE